MEIKSIFGKNRREMSSIIIDSRALLRLSYPFFILLFSNLVMTMVVGWQTSTAAALADSADPAVQAAIINLGSTVLNTLTVGVAIFGLFSFLLWVIYSHRIFGPAVPIRRQLDKLAKGIYDERIILRKTDEFHDVANDLNRLAEALNNNRGQSLAQVLVAAGVGMLVIMSILSSQASQSRENRALTEKLAANDLFRVISTAMANGSGCTNLFNAGNLLPAAALPFDSTTITAATPYKFALTSIPGAVPGTPIVTAGLQASSLSTSLKLLPITATPPGIQFVVTSMSPPSGTLNVNFDPSSTVRNIHNLQFPVNLVTSGAPTTLSLSGCGSSNLNSGIQVFPPLTTFTVPAGTYRLQVEAWGGGGAGCGGWGGSGGGGGYTQCLISVTPGDVYTVTVGAGGVEGGTCSVAACTCGSTPGGTSSFVGPGASTTVNCIATGGTQGTAGGGPGGGGATAASSASLGIINLSGGDGTDLDQCGSVGPPVIGGQGVIARGGAAPRGGDGGGATGGGAGPPASIPLTPGTAPGGGGPASCWGTTAGGTNGYAGNGAQGAVHVRW